MYQRYGTSRIPSGSVRIAPEIHARPASSTQTGFSIVTGARFRGRT